MGGRKPVRQACTKSKGNTVSIAHCQPLWTQGPAPRQGQSNALRRCSSRYGRGDGGKKGEVSISPVPDRKQNLADWKDVPRKGKGNVSADTDDSAGHGKGHGGTVAA